MRDHTTMDARAGIITLTLVFLLGCGQSAQVLEWEPTGGPTAQNVTALLADEKNPGAIFAGLSNGDIYLSTDFGKTWTLLHRSPQRKRSPQARQTG